METKLGINGTTLRCSKCRMVPAKNGPLQCRNGHVICHVCVEKTVRCPTCDVPMDPANAISCHIIADDVLKVIPFCCFFKQYGCTQDAMPRDQLKVHMRDCEFRKYWKVTDSEGDEKENADDSGESKQPQVMEKGGESESSVNGSSNGDEESNGDSNQRDDHITAAGGMDVVDSSGTSKERKGSSGDGNDADTELSDSSDGFEEKGRVEEGNRNESTSSAKGGSAKIQSLRSGNLGKKGKVEERKDSPPPAKRTRRLSGGSPVGVALSAEKKVSTHFSGGLGDHKFPMCDKCQRTFVNSRSLKKHQETVDCVKKLIAKTDGLKNQQEESRVKKTQKEAAVNDEAQEWTCTFCEEVYSVKWNLVRHIAVSHHYGVNENMEENGYFCPFCDLKLGYMEELRSHLNANHYDEI